MEAVRLAVLLQCAGWIAGSSVMLIGGGLRDDNDEIYGGFVELAGGPGVARIGVVTAASANPQGSADFYLPHFLMHGAVEVYWIPVHEGAKYENRNPIVVQNVHRMTGLFFGGGDQARLPASFYNEGREVSPVLEAMRDVYENYGAVGGTSAGCVGLSIPVMINGGMSYNALLNGAYVYGTAPTSSDLVYDPDGGLGFFGDYVLDSHFSERGREARLIRLISDTMQQPMGAQYGLGLDEDTALVITNAGGPAAIGEVIGTNGVFIADLSESVADSVDGVWRIQNVYADWLTAGDTIALNTHIERHLVNFDTSWKFNIIGDEMYNNAATSNDIFNGNRASPSNAPVYVRVARSPFDSRLANSTWGRTPSSPTPRFQVDFYQEEDSRAYGGYSPYNNGDWMISYSRQRISIGPDTIG